MKNAINWFAIPSSDFNRALKFYQAILEVEMMTIEMDETPMAFFPHDSNGGVGGHLFGGQGFNPSSDGSIVYLNGGDDLQIILDRVKPNGGQTFVGKTKISDENGYFAFFIDTEGNKVGLHSPK
jgi:predicted enzyme related to lactoylglutathione lyase